MIEEKAFQIKDELISIRRHLHRTPETDFEEIKTSSFIRSKLTITEYLIQPQLKQEQLP